MQRSLPHVQLDQLPSPEAADELLQRCLQLPWVRSQQSRMALPGSHALYLADALAAGPPESFIDSHEFCHLHPTGSLHLTLPKVLRDAVVRLGWGEPHPIASAGILTALLTVYSPRDSQEMDTVVGLVQQSCQFALGNLQDLYGDDSPLWESR
jgi:hypothetical protein